MKKKKKVRKRKKIVFNKSQKFMIAVAVIALAFCLFAVYFMFGKYNGLGMAKNINSNPYDDDCFYQVENRTLYEDDTYKSVPVIDVSAYQRDIDWNKVKADGIDYAMLRIGYRASKTGDINMDSYFKQNLKEAQKADIKVGVYFFSQAINTKEAIEEARYVVRHIRGRGIKLPVAFDMEYIHGGDRISELSKEEKTEIADAFCQVISRNGFEPIIYGNPTWLSADVDLRYLNRYDVWLAHYTYHTEYSNHFIMWQYTDNGTVNGIDGPVDFNVWIKKK